MFPTRILPALIAPVALGRPTRAANKRAEEYFKKGVEYYKRDHLEKALEKFRKSYAINGNPNTLYNIGQCLSRMGKLEEAVETYENYLKDRIKSPDPQADFAEVKMVQDFIAEMKKTLADLHKTLQASEKKDKYVVPPKSASLVASPAPRGDLAIAKTAPKISSKRKWAWTSLTLSAASFAASGASLYMARKKQLEHGNLVDRLKTQGEVVEEEGHLHFASASAKQSHADSLNDLDQTMKRYNAVGIVTLSAGAAFLAGGLTLLRSDRRGRVASKVSLEPTLGSEVGLGLNISF